MKGKEHLKVVELYDISTVGKGPISDFSKFMNFMSSQLSHVNGIELLRKRENIHSSKGRESHIEVSAPAQRETESVLAFQKDT